MSTDANSNAAIQVIRTVDVVDTTAPVITLLGSDPVTVEVGTTYTDAGATATDIGDGNLTGLHCHRQSSGSEHCR